MNSPALKAPEVPAQEPLKPVAEYLPFVKKVAHRLARRLPSHVGLDDLIGAGVVGLMEAMKRYDPARMSGFEKFAEFRVKGAILDELRRRELMARDARLESKNLEQTIAELAQSYGREPEQEEIAEYLGVSVEHYRSRLEKLTPVRVVSFSDVFPINAADSEESPFEEFAKKEMVGQLSTAIEKLSERQQQVLQLYYIEDLTLNEIGQVLGVTESRVCQILSESTIRLRSIMNVRAPAKAKRGGPYG